MDNLSAKERIQHLPFEDQRKFYDNLTEEEAEFLLHNWEFHGRPKQLEGITKFGEWFIWVILAGRGFGKTRTGAEMCRWLMQRGYRRLGIISPTSADIRDVVVEGESGILTISSNEDRPQYEPTKRRLTWPNGAIASLYSAEEPERLRGPQHDAVWIDELAAVSSPEIAQRMFDMTMFGLRLKPDIKEFKKHMPLLTPAPVCFITTTPKPIPLVQDLVRRSKLPSERVLITTGSTYENINNLAQSFRKQILQYEGTLLGRQEIHAEVLNLEEQGIIKRSWFKLWPDKTSLPYFDYIVASFDSAFTDKTHGDPTACTVWGIFRPSSDGTYCIMLLDAWAEHLNYPDLREKVREYYFDARFGDSENIATNIDPYTTYTRANPYIGGEAQKNTLGQKIDIVLVEAKGSGISLIQDLSRMGVPVRAYDPTKKGDKAQRLHSVSHLVCNGRVYLIESSNVAGQPVTWSSDFVTEVCTFPMALHDDYTDTFSQALALVRDQGFLSIEKVEEEETYADDEVRGGFARNPYSV